MGTVADYILEEAREFMRETGQPLKQLVISEDEEKRLIDELRDQTLFPAESFGASGGFLTFSGVTLLVWPRDKANRYHDVLRNSNLVRPRPADPAARKRRPSPSE